MDKIFKKLGKKESAQLETIAEKVQEILRDPYAFKPMRFPLQGQRRVHFGSFVLLYSIDEQRKTVVLEDYDHHDRIYKQRK